MSLLLKFVLLTLFLIAFFIFIYVRYSPKTTVRRSRPIKVQARPGKEEEIVIKKTLKVSPNHFSESITEENVNKNKVVDFSKPLEIVSLYVMAPSEYGYSGYELLQSLLMNGLRYGEQNIFHRYETQIAGGNILFSLASVNKPGTFELSKMGGFSCPGLVLFILLNRTADPMHAFDLMLETARQLSEDLGGEIWDEEHQILNVDKIAQIRLRIHHFEKTQRIPDFFEETQTLES